MKKLINPDAYIGKEATIKVGPYKGEWGIIQYYDGDFFHIALWGGDDALIFEPHEIKIH